MTPFDSYASGVKVLIFAHARARQPGVVTPIEMTPFDLYASGGKSVGFCPCKSMPTGVSPGRRTVFMILHCFLSQMKVLQLNLDFYFGLASHITDHNHSGANFNTF